jgi:uncharacterized protein (TIGR02145 family)
MNKEKKHNSILIKVFISAIVLISINTCRKFESEVAVTTGSISEITTNSVLIGGVIIDCGEGIIRYGHCWSDAINADINDHIIDLGSRNSTGGYNSQITGLQPNTTYYIKAFAEDDNNIAYGEEISFTTVDNSLPVIKTGGVTNITINSAIVYDTLIDFGLGIDEIIQYGHCWDTAPDPSVSKSKTELGTKSTPGYFSSSLTSLKELTTYYVRAYAINIKGTAYGAQVELITRGILPLVKTDSITNITGNSAFAWGNLLDFGINDTNVTQLGFCWSVSAKPTTAQQKISFGSRNYTGTYSGTINGLTKLTKYYLRAFAINSKGTDYGKEISFTTKADLPSVTSISVSSISFNSAQSGGNVTYDGGAAITARGVCWSTSPNPSATDNHTSDGTGEGAFTSSLTGLQPGTKYYVRAYATNSAGTAYGNEYNFTTNAILPVVTTAEAASITHNSAQSGGEITNNGGANISARGVCWNTSANPTILDNHTTNGTGSGIFTSSITGLIPLTKYYARAYATNSAGTSYGNEINFTTISNVATVLTTTAYKIYFNRAMAGGNVTDDGGSTVTDRGICWGTSPNPTISDYYMYNGSGLGSYTDSLTNLEPNTTYYLRAFASNSLGINFGNQVLFTTDEIGQPCTGTPTVTDLEGHIYNTVQIGDQCWLKENLNMGTIINHENDQTNNGIIEKYCYSDNADNCAIYGGLYLWDEMMQYQPSDYANPGTTRGVCPSGWHIPTYIEWQNLLDYIGDNGTEGILLKETGTSHWNSNTDATNLSGFTALPGGGYNVSNYFYGIHNIGYWWSSTEMSTKNAWQLYMWDGDDVTVNDWGKHGGRPVRCVKD